MPLPSLSRRSTEPEYFDDPGNSDAELAAMHRDLVRLNRLFRFARPFQLFLPALVGVGQCQRLKVLDVGAGSGELGRELTAWAANRGWQWQITSLDVNPRGLGIGNGDLRVVGSALALPFGNDSFDCVIASQMTHHLESDADVVQHFREAWRVSRLGVFFSDIHRQRVVYLMVWCAAFLAGCSARLRSDGATSVARGFRIAEFKDLAAKAGIVAPHASVYCGARILLQARKGPLEGRR